MELTAEMNEELTDNRDHDGEEFWKEWGHDGIEAGVQDDIESEH